MSSKWPPNGSHFGAIGHPKSQKIQKNEHSKKTWKIGCKKYQQRSQKGTVFSGGVRSPKSLKIQDIVKMGLQASKMTPRASKIIKKWTPGPPKSPKIMRIWWPKIKKSGYPKSKKTWKKRLQDFQEIKMRHGGGLCAQRAGYYKGFHCPPLSGLSGLVSLETLA